MNEITSMSIRLDQLNINMNFNNHDLTLPSLETLTQGIILELDFSIHSCDNNTMNALEPIQNLSLVHLKLIDCTLQK